MGIYTKEKQLELISENITHLPPGLTGGKSVQLEFFLKALYI